uniref:Thrombospondin type 1 domain containing 4 n=1 Tax=Salarias fasciatus TaxID=181472 RepID=A0A672IHX0_SALFA
MGGEVCRSGRSIINGNWAIDRPGKYEGGGTMFTYRRPNEISSTAGESFLAEGPTNEILDVYQPNPGVHYEYLLPSETHTRQEPNHRPEGRESPNIQLINQPTQPTGRGLQPAAMPSIVSDRSPVLLQKAWHC